MAIADSPQANKEVAVGECILDASSPAGFLVVLNKGTVTVKSADSEFGILRLFDVEGPAILAAEALAAEEAPRVHIFAKTPAVISSYRVNRESLLKYFQSKPNIAILFLRSLLKGTAELVQLLPAAKSLLALLNKNILALGLAYYKMAPDQYAPEKIAETHEDDEFFDQPLRFARNHYQTFLEKSGVIPERLTPQFLLADHSMLLGIPDEIEMNYSMEKDNFQYFKQFISLPTNILGAICQNDPLFILNTAKRIAEEFKQAIELAESCRSENLYLVNSLWLGDYSWLEKIYLQWQLNEKKAGIADKNDLSFLGDFTVETVEMIKSRVSRLYDIVAKFDENKLKYIKDHSVITPQQTQEANQQPAASEESSRIEVSESAMTEVKDMLMKVINYGNVDKKKVTELQEALQKLKRLKNPLDSDPDVRRIRRTVNNMYWECYTDVATKFAQSKEATPRFIEMFLDFGVMDETLLEPHHLSYIYNVKDPVNCKYPIPNAREWIKAIYNKQYPPSINDLGMTYFELLRQDNRDKGWKRDADIPAEYTSGPALLKFELKSMFEPTVKLCSGSIMNHLAILSRYQLTQPIEKCLVTKERLSEEIDKLLQIDFSAFHREVLYSNEEMGIQREFVQIQVIPNFVLAPSAGNVFQFWMDRDSKAKESKGRLVCPRLATGDLYDMLLSVTAAYRWELTKAILGPDWNNISSSSITADYTDYVQFFKKNRELSTEAKEKLATELKRFRDDRSRFINDYITWVKYESEGTQRFNKVARKIFSKHIPFSKPYREKLLKLPSYVDLITKSQNVRVRKAKELEPRIKKIKSNNNDRCPAEIIQTYKFFNMEF